MRMSNDVLVLMDSADSRIYRIVDETYLEDIEFEAFNGIVIEINIDPALTLSDAIKIYA